MSIADSLRIGIDIGGTFTDFVIFDRASGAVESFKILSTPDNPSQAVLDGLQMLGFTQPEPRHFLLVHGSTVATNALLERKGVRTALIATQGFADVLQIGRQNRPALYDLLSEPIPPLIPSEFRFEVEERIDATGNVIKDFNPEQLNPIITSMQEQQVLSVAVCLLFSFLHPSHELEITRILRNAGFHVSASYEILPEFREYERMSTTAVNAYVSPILDKYLSHLENELSENVHLRIMQSNGGAINAKEARRNGVRCILSGPAGGIVGCQYIAEIAFSDKNLENHPLKLITFDMGGTSTDVSLINGSPIITTETQINGLPIGIPVLDIHTIGAGGGSIAKMDAGGALRVGPESAGAKPGPACYSPLPPGQDSQNAFPTVTDANLVLGRLIPEYFLGGKMPLNLPRAQWVMKELGASSGMDAVQTALGVIEVVNTHMERALRVISVERGHDPKDFTLISFGGAGGLHAADLARRLGIPQVLVSPQASVLSALGMLAADVIKDYSHTIMAPSNITEKELLSKLEPLYERAYQDMATEGFSVHEIIFQPALDMRYLGQSYELTVPWRVGRSDCLEGFHRMHELYYGYAQYNQLVEIVNIRLRVIGPVPKPILPKFPKDVPDPSNAVLGHRPVIFSSLDQTPLPTEALLVRGELLKPGNLLNGPALIVRNDTTILLPPGDQARVDEFLNLWITVQPLEFRTSQEVH